MYNQPTISKVGMVISVHITLFDINNVYEDSIGGFLLLRIFSVAISVSPHVCFILHVDLILISMFLR